jgi:hypothetical protein
MISGTPSGRRRRELACPYAPADNDAEVIGAGYARADPRATAARDFLSSRNGEGGSESATL